MHTNLLIPLLEVRLLLVSNYCRFKYLSLNFTSQ